MPYELKPVSNQGVSGHQDGIAYVFRRLLPDSGLGAPM